MLTVMKLIAINFDLTDLRHKGIPRVSSKQMLNQMHVNLDIAYKLT